MKRKARGWKPVIGTVLIGILLFTGIYLLKRSSDMEFMIGKYGISREHLALYEHEARAKVASYFYTRYQKDSNAVGFWDSEVEGEVPSRVLYEEAVRMLTSDTVERIEARNHGISTAITLDEIRKALMEENERRRIAGETAYGPDQYGLMEYLSKTQMEVRDRLKEELLKGELKPSQEQLAAIYEKADPAFFDKGCKASIGIYMYYGMKVGTYPKELEQVWPFVKEEIEKGSDPAQIVSRASLIYGVEIGYDEAEYDTDYLPRDNQPIAWLVDRTRDMEAGASSGVLDYEASQGIVKVLKKEEYGRAAYGEVRTLLVNMWINEQYPVYIKKCIAAYE